jgi:hypothetical protein
VLEIRESASADRIAMLEGARGHLVAKRLEIERKIQELEQRRSGVKPGAGGPGREER